MFKVLKHDSALGSNKKGPNDLRVVTESCQAAERFKSGRGFACKDGIRCCPFNSMCLQGVKWLFSLGRIFVFGVGVAARRPNSRCSQVRMLRAVVREKSMSMSMAKDARTWRSHEARGEVASSPLEAV